MTPSGRVASPALIRLCLRHVYDALNRLTQKTYPDSTTVDYTYDLVGKILQVNDPTGTYGFSYDSLSRRTQLTRPNGITTTYNYDSLSRLLSVLHRLRPARALEKRYQRGPQGAP